MTVGPIRVAGPFALWFPGVFCAFMVGMLGVTYLLSVRGYELADNALLILRPIGPKRVSLVGLQDVTAEPDILKGSIRTCGNGGLFCFSGWYWNRRLKTYRMWVTDPKRAVLLRFADKRIVISPDEPAAFVAAVRTVATVAV
jgi:hypothetical protein